MQQNFAHSLEGRPETAWHLLCDHLNKTARLAADRAGKFGAEDYGHVAGLLHDIGKYSEAFQSRIRGGGNRVDHSTAGAQLAAERYKLPGALIAYAIAGHHAGLADWVSEENLRSGLRNRLGSEVKPYGSYKSEIEPPTSLPVPPFVAARAHDADWQQAFSAAFFTRMLFSALVDADFLDTEAFYDQAEGRRPRNRQFPTITDLHDTLEGYLAALSANARPGWINSRRAEIQHAARDAAGAAPGLFSLTVPTGGGKTLASLLFALAHARKHGLDRVVVAIPYTSIIEQTAKTFREALPGLEDAILEHHSAFDETKNAEAEARDKLNKAMENWDAPIVVTSNVQLFESLFADRPSRCRKLHNLARAVIVLDEAQMLPLQLLRPCVATLAELADNYGTSVVLCTATQPALTAESGFRKAALTEVREIAPEPQQLYRDFKRVTVINAGTLNDAELADRLAAEKQVLCILHTRAHAREIAQALASDMDGIFHLSASLCAKHRSEKLSLIKTALADGAPCRVISTSLIEAGVDVDFPVVYRAAAGLDSIAQAAGRCNREGRHSAEDSVVHVFTSDAVSPPSLLRRQATIGQRCLERHAADPLSLDAIGDYFREIYWLESSGNEDGLDEQNILRDGFRIEGGKLIFAFSRVAGEFRMIESHQQPVLIPWDATACDAIAGLRDGTEKVGRLARKLQQYTVQIPPWAFEALKAAGVIQPVAPERLGDQFWELMQDSYKNLYSPDFGLDWRDPAYRSAAGNMF